MHIRLAALAAILTVSLTACGGSGDTNAEDPAGEESSAAAPQDGAGGGPGGGDPEQLAEIQECLEAAGLADSIPTQGPQGDGPPSGIPTDRPSDIPSDFPSDFPSGFPTDGTPPEGFPSGGPGGGFADDPEVQAALEACGIDLPQAPGTTDDR